ncbi:DinB family protein [uncultured Neptuniibacter sp.]|uniref:DinB family protein n=1 Tax=uncultured Neptuniibacter sp. TaxID=502143 RepID=UPI00260BD960|nr:DinB family protein [uncultured Neptuniibacter sp.]
MTLKDQFELMARYNQWMNESVFDAANELDKSDLVEDRGAFFGSVIGTLNHILVGDIIWLKRFSAHPSGFDSLNVVRAMESPKTLTTVLYDDLEALQDTRYQIDLTLIELCDEMEIYDLSYPITYCNMQGNKFEKRFGYLLQHLFNHQTHHRGQVTVLLNQLGVELAVTDLLAVIPEA